MRSGSYQATRPLILLFPHLVISNPDLQEAATYREMVLEVISLGSQDCGGFFRKILMITLFLIISLILKNSIE